MNHPLLLVLMTAAGIYVAKLWRDDLAAGRKRGEGAVSPANTFPGATPAPARAVVIAIAGALGLLAAETFFENKLGLAAQQSRMTWLFALYSAVAAPVVEELIFRGWIVIENHGRAAMWSGAIGASLIFAALHQFLWQWEGGGFVLTPTAKGWFSTGAIFAGSLWFYAARLAAWNPRRSLLPCFAAHAAKNLGVVAIKAATGFVGGLW